MKKILFVHLLNDFSGSPKVLSQVISAANNKYDVELYTGKSEAGFLTNCSDIHHQYYYKWFNNKFLTLGSFMLSQIILFFKIISRKDSYEIIYVNTMLPFGAAMAGKFMGKQVIYHIHETSIKPEIFKRFLKFIILKTADKIIYVSSSLKESENFVEIKNRIIYNSLDQVFLKKAKGNLIQEKESQCFNVLMICSLKAYKGVEEFIIIAKTCEKSEVEFTLVLNADMNEIEQFFSNFDMPSNLKIVGRQKDVHKFYCESNLLLNLTRPDECVETFGLTIIEAMAYGLPVIVPPVGGPAEIVREGKEGYLISSYETSKIANKILELAQNKDLFQQLSRKAIIRSEDFNEGTFHKEILQVINE